MRLFGRCVAILGVCLLQAACVTSPGEPSLAGARPEAIIPTPPETIKPQIAASMLASGYRIRRDTAFEIVFDRPVESAAAAAKLGASYDSRPNTRISYSFAPSGADTRVVADMEVIANPGTAAEQRTPMNHGADSRHVQDLLDRLKAEADPSSAASVVKRNGTVLGVGTVAAAEAGTYGLVTAEKKGLVVVAVDRGSVAEKAGLRANDALLSVNAKEVNSNGDLTTALASIKPGGNANVEISRAGTRMSVPVTFARATRQASAVETPGP